MAWKPPLSCDLSGEVFGEKRTTMRCSVAETQKPQVHSPLLTICGSATYLWEHTSKLENLLTGMSKKAGLAQVYTPHWIRATSVTVLKAAGLENCRVKSVTCHASDKSIESYTTPPTIEQYFESSAIFSRFLSQ